MLNVDHANHLVCALVHLGIVAAQLGVVHAFSEVARRVRHGLACWEVLSDFEALVRQYELDELAAGLTALFQDMVVGLCEKLFVLCFHEGLKITQHVHFLDISDLLLFQRPNDIRLLINTLLHREVLVLIFEIEIVAH